MGEIMPVRSRLGSVLLAAAALLAGGLVVAAAPAGAAPAPWTVRSVLSLATDTTAISCSAPTACWAVEAGKLLSSPDAGQHWNDRTALVPRRVLSLQAVSCVPGSQRCYFTATTAAGPRLLTLYQNKFTVFPIPTPRLVPALVCLAASKCVATDGYNAYVTVDGAQTWAVHPLAAIVYTTPALDCFAAHCWVVGDRGEIPLIEYSADGGTTWTMQNAPANTDGMYALSCPDSNTCYAGGATMTPDAATIIATHNRGRTWTVEPVPSQPYGVQSIDCLSATSCTAVGYSPAYTAFVFGLAGGTWTRQTVAQTETLTPGAVACPATRTCAIVAGGLGYSTVDDGTTWLDQPLPEGLEAPQSLSCPTATHCVGVGTSAGGQTQLVTSDDAGTTWTQHPAPSGLGRVWGVDCPSATTCMAVSEYDVPGTPRIVARAIVTHDGGVTWARSKVTDSGGALHEISCASDTTCLAGGYDNRSAAKLMATTDSGTSWHAITPPPGFYLNSVACSSPTACVVMASDPNAPQFAYTTADLGQTYTKHSLPAIDQVSGLDCVGSFCVAGGYDGGDGRLLQSADSGATWTAVNVPNNIQMLSEVSCGSATACAVSGYDFSQTGGPLVVSTNDAGATWTVHTVPARHESLISIACYQTACIGSDVSVAGNPIIVGGSV